MKKIFLTMMAIVPLTLWAQDNSWEQDEDELKTEVQEAPKPKVDVKYLKGAVSGMFEERLEELSQKPDCPFMQAD